MLIGAFRFAALQAVIINKALSLVVVASALPFRAAAVPFAGVAANWPIIADLLAGSLLGAWFGAGWATRLASQTLYRVISGLLLAITVVLLLGHDAASTAAILTGPPQMAAGVSAGLIIGIVAALLGVAGGELLIPTLVLLFGADIRLAGSLSLAVSLPTMLVGFGRYSRDRSFVVLAENRRFVLVMAAGSIFGSFIGGRLLGLVPNRSFCRYLPSSLCCRPSRFGGTDELAIWISPSLSMLRTYATRKPLLKGGHGAVRQVLKSARR